MNAAAAMIPEGIALFTQYEMRCYYTIRTVQNCTHCGCQMYSHLSPKINVESTTKAGKMNLPLTEVLRRYAAIYNTTEEQAKIYLPALPFEIRDYVIDVDQCEECIPATFGNPESKLPPMLPADIPEKYAPATSANYPKGGAHNPTLNQKQGRKIKNAMRGVQGSGKKTGPAPSLGDLLREL